MQATNGIEKYKEGDIMANISEEKWIEMLEKKADGSYIAKYPKVKSKSGVTFEGHLADYATLDKAGHVKAETDAEGKLILDIPKSNYDADRIPNENDDETQGYSVGSMWFVNFAGKKMGYICIESSANNAIWQLLGSESEVNLYDAGNEYDYITGGWVEGRTEGSGSEFVKHPSHISIVTMPMLSSKASAVTNNLIDLSGIDTLYCYITSTYGSTTDVGIKFTVSTNKTRSYDDEAVAFTYLSKGVGSSGYTMELDVRGINGMYYVVIHGAGVSEMKIYRVWGE